MIKVLRIIVPVAIGMVSFSFQEKKRQLSEGERNEKQ